VHILRRFEASSPFSPQAPERPKSLRPVFEPLKRQLDAGFRGAGGAMGCGCGEFEGGHVTADWWVKGGYKLGRPKTRDDGWKSCVFGEGGGLKREEDGWPGKGISHLSPRNPFRAMCRFAVWNGTAGAAADR